MSADVADGWAVVANHPHHGRMRENAKCIVLHNPGLGRVLVAHAIKGRRWAQTWVRADRLYNVRVRRMVVQRDGTVGLALRQKDEAEISSARLIADGASPAAPVQEDQP